MKPYSGGRWRKRKRGRVCVCVGVLCAVCVCGCVGVNRAGYSVVHPEFVKHLQLNHRTLYDN